MKKDFKVFVADIDGTLVCKGEKMLPRTRAALEKLHEQGVLIGVATGRPLDQRILAKPKEWELSFDFDFAIGMNGGDLWDKDHEGIEHYYPLPKETVHSILTFLEGCDINAIVYEKGYDQICCLRMDDFMQDSIRRNRSHVDVGDIDRMARYDTGKIEVHCRGHERQRIYDRVEAHQTPEWQTVETYTADEHFTIEFQDPRVNKGMGLAKFCARNHIDPNDIIAFGDMENDIPLLQRAGWGVSLLNGSEDTKKIADAVTDFSVEEDGIGKYLEEHYFS